MSDADKKPDEPESCGGVASVLKPWQRHALCRTCKRYTWIGLATIKPAMIFGVNRAYCANRIEERGP